VKLPENLDREDLEAVTMQVVKEQVLEYQCPVCPNRIRIDIAGLEPCCTGPGYTDEHAMEIMVLVDPERARTVVAI
jgi:hypothetical protein